MKEFKIRFSLKPAVRLAPKLTNVELNFDEPKSSKKVVISKIEEEMAGHKIQTGLELKVFLQAENLKEAIIEAKSFVDGIVSFITLVTGVGLDIPSENLAYEITPGVEERDFVQIFHDPFQISISRRRLDHQLFITMMDHFMKLDSKTKQLVARAIRWYRMGAMTPDVFDRFNCFWIGLEALNPILQRRFSIRDDPVKCPDCGYEWIATPTVSGIRTFVQGQIPDGKKLYRRIHKLRINIMHSKRELGALHKEASKLAPRTAEVLFRAIGYILELKGWEGVAYKYILEKVPARIELEATLVGGEPNALGPEGKDPFFEPAHTVFMPKVVEDKVTFEGTSSFTARLNPKVKWRPREVRFYGDSEITGSITKTEVGKRDEESE
jgi:hypothetical protein